MPKKTSSTGESLFLTSIEGRISALEASNMALENTIGRVEGSVNTLVQSVSTMTEILGTISQSGKKGEEAKFIQKVLIGAIIVQSMLTGLATPETAKKALSAIFGAALQ